MLLAVWVVAGLALGGEVVDEMRCSPLSTGQMGSNIDCTPLCNQICENVIDCPCNDNGRGVGCWVPKLEAQRMCHDLKDCHVISEFSGDVRESLPFYQGWVHLGDFPVVPARGFVANVCDKSYEEARAGCFSCSLDCPASNNASCLECFSHSRNPAVPHTSMQYCDGYDGVSPSSPCQECSCCSFMSHGQCGFSENKCFPERPLCPAKVVDVFHSGDNCPAWIDWILLGREPSIASTCMCINSRRSALLSLGAATNCKLVSSALHAVSDLLTKCEGVRMCSQDDDCGGCRTYLKDKMWVLTRSLSTPTVTCGFHSIENSCVVKDSTGVLHAESPCSTRNASLALLPSDWGWSSNAPNVLSPVPLFVPASYSPSPTPHCVTEISCPNGYIVRQSGEPIVCFDPIRDCEVDPCANGRCDPVVKTLTQSSFGNSSCPYCMSGDDWTGLCATGMSQSPIRIEWDSVDTDPSAMQYFTTNYTVQTVPLLLSSGQLRMAAGFGSINYDGEEFVAESVSFHAPAEHQIEGVTRSAVEVQIRHRSRLSTPSNPKYVMIAVLFDEHETGNSLEMAKILNNPLPNIPGLTVNVVDFDLNKIVDTSKPLMWYQGSYTIPPCTENISWAIQMGANSKLSRQQVHNINSLFKDNPSFANGHGNNRRKQSINGRRMTLRSSCGGTGAIACAPAAQLLLAD